MKHNKKVTTLLITMFLVTQLIGLFVIKFYNSPENQLPFGMEPDDNIKSLAEESPTQFITYIFIAFMISIGLFFLLTKIKAEVFIRLWFLIVTIIAIGIALNSFIHGLNSWYDSLDLFYTSIILIALALPLAYFKIFKRDILVHNITELFIYPGISVVFVPLLGIWGIIILLLIISVYDMWAVWHSGIMQKMAKYQIDTLKFFTGFFVPYVNRKQKMEIKRIRDKYTKKGNRELEKQFKKAKIKIHLAILGGGDIVFPIITAGVFYKVFYKISPLIGLYSALIIIASATLALFGLFILARKGKFYPAMPFLTGGMYLGMIINWLIFCKFFNFF